MIYTLVGKSRAALKAGITSGFNERTSLVFGSLWQHVLNAREVLQ